jgi:hypothetical protein
MDLNSTTFLKAAGIMAPQLGLSMPQDRLEVLTYVNKYRNLLYNMYADVKLFDDYKVCLPIQRFSQQCVGVCSDYFGVTIPDNVAGVVAAWEYGQPLSLRSRWREAFTGLHDGSSPHMELVQMPETSPTERLLGSLSILRIFTHSAEDDGKVVTVYGKDSQGAPKVASFTLIHDTFVNSTFEFTEISEVVLPDLCSTIEMRDKSDCTLSVYYPHEHIPKYRRYKINAPCGTQSLLIQGTRRYQDLALDTDVVEVGDRLIIEAAGRYFRYSEETTEKKDIQRAEYDLKTLKDLLSGIISRHRGRNVQDGSPFHRTTKRTIRKGL